MEYPVSNEVLNGVSRDIRRRCLKERALRELEFILQSSGETVTHLCILCPEGRGQIPPIRRKNFLACGDRIEIMHTK